MAATAENTTNETESRQSVIAAAVAAAGAEDAKETEKAEKKAPEVSSEATKEEKKPTEVKKEEPSEDAILAEQGKQLILALRDPEKAGAVIKFLAEQAGYTKAELKAAAGAGKEGVQEVADDILDVIKGEMGEEFDVISERLAKALKKILPAQIEKSQADIRKELQEREAEKLKGQSAAALEKMTTDFFGAEEELPSEVSNEMSKYMDRVQPSPTMTVKELVEDAFHFAVGKLGLVKTDKAKSAKTDKNRTDAASRLSSSERAPASNNLKTDNSKPLTRQQAIAAAIEAANKE